MSLFGVVSNIQFCFRICQRAWAVWHLQLLLMNILNKTESGVFITLDQLAKPTFRSHYAHTPFGHGREWRTDGHRTHLYNVCDFLTFKGSPFQNFLEISHYYVIDEVYWFRDVLFKLRGGHSPPSSLNTTVEKACTLSCLQYGPTNQK